MYISSRRVTTTRSRVRRDCRRAPLHNVGDLCRAMGVTSRDLDPTIPHDLHSTSWKPAGGISRSGVRRSSGSAMQMTILHVEVPRKRARSLIRDAWAIDEACFCIVNDVRVAEYASGRVRPAGAGS